MNIWGGASDLQECVHILWGWVSDPQEFVHFLGGGQGHYFRRSKVRMIQPITCCVLFTGLEVYADRDVSEFC